MTPIQRMAVEIKQYIFFAYMNSKRIIWLLSFVGLALLTDARDYKYTSVANDPMQTRIYTLENGLRVYTSVNQEKPRVTVHIAVNTGHKNDPAETTGLAHYLEHLMFKGSMSFGTTDYSAEKPYLDKIMSLYEEYRKLTDTDARKAKYHEIDSVSQLAARYNIPNEYDKLMAAIGGEGSNAYTWFDITCYTEDIPSNEIEAWAKIQSDRFRHLVVRGFHTELEAVYEEKNISLAADDEKASDALFAKLFPTHSYGTQTTLGTQQHLKNPSIVNIMDYYHRYYVPNNIAICMAGDFEPEKVLPVIEQYFGDWKPGDDPSGRKFPVQPCFTVPQDTTVVGQEQETLSMGWRFNAGNSRQCDTLGIVAKLLCNHRAGLVDLDLNQKMKVQRASVGFLPLKDYSVLYADVVPQKGQTLEEARDLMLAEVEKLKNGDFDEEMLVSIINNKKRRFYQEMENNRSRVSMMVDAFINERTWEDVVGETDRWKAIGKNDIVGWAKEHLNHGYAIVYKRQGEDKSVEKIDKPAITPIPSNRDNKSQFFVDMTKTVTEPIQPVFLNYNEDLRSLTMKNGIPVVYKQNVENGLFNLMYRFDFGVNADKRYDIATDYLALLGTERYTADELKKAFYNLACDYQFSVSDENLYISLSGLSENMPKAMRLVEDMLLHAKVDKDVYTNLVGTILKRREAAKKEQRACFEALYKYALWGPEYIRNTTMSEEELKNTNPEELLTLMRNLGEYKHQVVYYGPLAEKDFMRLLSKEHRVSRHFIPAPQNTEYKYCETPTTDILLAPYEAANIYLRMYHNENDFWRPDEEPMIYMFNEYFGTGMNTIVFQELRESRGLAYNAYARYYSPSDKKYPEYWMEHIISQNDKMMDCIKVFKEITDNMPQSESAFNVAKQNLLKNLATQRTTKYRVLTSFLQAQKRGIDYDINKTIYEAVPSVSLQDVVAFEKKRMADKPMRYVVLGNEKQLDMEALKKVGPVKRVSLKEVFGY